MGLDLYHDAVRRLDLASFTGDVWALDATLALPGADVPLLVGDGSPMRWKLFGMSSGKNNATQVIDTTTSLSSCLVKVSRTKHTTIVAACVAVAGTIIAHGITENDVADKDVFAIAIPSIVVGTAPWLWIVPTSGFSGLATGIS